MSSWNGWGGMKGNANEVELSKILNGRLKRLDCGQRRVIESVS